MNELPDWLAQWWKSQRSGTSSRFLAARLSNCIPLQQIVEYRTPGDNGDFGRCFDLLDLAEANGLPWRERIGELASTGVQWQQIAEHWKELEAAYKEDEAAWGAYQKAIWTKKDGGRRKIPASNVPFPPRKCTLLLDKCNHPIHHSA